MKCVTLLSGGIDSTVMMYALVERYEVWPLTVNYGQRHLRETISARMVCEARGGSLLQRFEYIDLSGLAQTIKCALHGQGTIPDGPYTDETINSCVSPNRNMILLAVAAGYAQSIGASTVAYAAHANDSAVYPDCRPEFVKSVGETILLATGGIIGLLAPFITWHKSSIVRLGAGLNVPFKKTYSCYRGDEVHCGECPTCVDRKDAFVQADVADPTRYGTGATEEFVQFFGMKGQS